VPSLVCARAPQSAALTPRSMARAASTAQPAGYRPRGRGDRGGQRAAPSTRAARPPLSTYPLPPPLRALHRRTATTTMADDLYIAADERAREARRPRRTSSRQTRRGATRRRRLSGRAHAISGSRDARFFAGDKRSRGEIAFQNDFSGHR
jgi:hypothetical protein